MPTLPSITVTDAQYERLRLAIPGGTPAEQAAAYQTMVRAMLRRAVIDAEVRAAAEQAAAAVELARTQAAANPDNV